MPLFSKQNGFGAIEIKIRLTVFPADLPAIYNRAWLSNFEIETFVDNKSFSRRICMSLKNYAVSLTFPLGTVPNDLRRLIIRYTSRSVSQCNSRSVA